MCLDTVTDMNETLNTVTVYNFDAAIDLGYGFCPPPPTSPPTIFGGLRELMRTKFFLTFVEG